jgi:hypothetical protein
MSAGTRARCSSSETTTHECQMFSVTKGRPHLGQYHSRRFASATTEPYRLSQPAESVDEIRVGVRGLELPDHIGK